MPETLTEEEAPPAPTAGSGTLRRTLALGVGSFLAAGLIRLLRRTSRVEFRGREVLEELRREGRPLLLAFWHEQLLLMPYVYSGPGIAVMVSRHGDGEWIARTVARFGIDSIRGSTTRGGSRALRSLVRRLQEGRDAAFTPDGPRGPRRRVQGGVLTAARLSGVPVLPVALGASRAWRLRSWDRFLVPKPLGRLAYVYGRPFPVPRHLDAAELEARRRELERVLDGLSEEAERLAGGGAR